MNIEIYRVAVEAVVTCDHCGTAHDVSVDDGDTYFSEAQMEQAVIESLTDWDGNLCPDCVYDRDNPEEEDN